MPLSSIFCMSCQMKGVRGDFFFKYIETVYKVDPPFQIDEICNSINCKIIETKVSTYDDQWQNINIDTLQSERLGCNRIIDQGLTEDF